MRLKETIAAAKKIIKGRKKDKKLWSKADVAFAKLSKERAEKNLKQRHLTNT